MSTACETCKTLRKWLADEKKKVDELTNKLKDQSAANSSLRRQLKSSGSLDATVVSSAVAKAITAGMNHYVAKTTKATVKALIDNIALEAKNKHSEAISRRRFAGAQKRADNMGR
jgi:hypothetical protein